MGDDQDTAGISYSGDIDPEIAELMGIDDEEEASDPGKPEFVQLFGAGPASSEKSTPEVVDLSRKRFPVITQTEQKPLPIFQDKQYYKTALGGEGEPAKRFHHQLGLFLNAQDPQEKSMHRGRVLSAYWNLAATMALRSHANLPVPKRMVLRFGAVVPTLISQEQRIMLSKVIFENKTGEPVHYIDEWMHQVATGVISQSATDEVKVKKRDEGAQIAAKLEKAKGQRETNLGLLQGKLDELQSAEQDLKEAVRVLTERSPNPSHPGLYFGYSDEQRSRFAEISGILRRLSVVDKEVGRLYAQLEGATENVDALEDKASETGSATVVDYDAVQNEFNTVRQMTKMCVGRQGNHMPILMKQYFRSSIRDIGTRENVIAELAAVEAIDPGIFERTFKRQTNRIVPHIILVPCYGDSGICWEPFERFNRATSRGRIAIPIFPKDLKSAVIGALADLRWQVAKERAQHYWMEEGLTGYYYQWFTDGKRRGDVKESFVQDYILWITKESEGMQKLDREVRSVFWRYIPFPQPLREKLRNRGFVYEDLYKKDLNREASDGY